MLLKIAFSAIYRVNFESFFGSYIMSRNTLSEDVAYLSTSLYVPFNEIINIV